MIWSCLLVTVGYGNAIGFDVIKDRISKINVVSGAMIDCEDELQSDKQGLKSFGLETKQHCSILADATVVRSFFFVLL